MKICEKCHREMEAVMVTTSFTLYQDRYPMTHTLRVNAPGVVLKTPSTVHECQGCGARISKKGKTGRCLRCARRGVSKGRRWALTDVV